MKLYKYIPRFSYGDGTPVIFDTGEASTLISKMGIKEYALRLAYEEFGDSEQYRGVEVFPVELTSIEAQEWLKNQIHDYKMMITDAKERIKLLEKHLTK